MRAMFFDRYGKPDVMSFEGRPVPEPRHGEVLIRDIIERSVIVCETANFSVDESWLSQKPPERKAESQLCLPEKVTAQERELIEAALRGCQGRVFGPSGAAARLGIARSTLESKIRSLKINKNRFRPIPGT